MGSSFSAEILKIGIFYGRKLKVKFCKHYIQKHIFYNVSREQPKDKDEEARDHYWVGPQTCPRNSFIAGFAAQIYPEENTCDDSAYSTIAVVCRDMKTFKKTNKKDLLYPNLPPKDEYNVNCLCLSFKLEAGS